MVSLVKSAQGMLSASHDTATLHNMAAALFNLFDTNGDGVVDRQELYSALSVLCAGGWDSRLVTAFCMLDQDGDGRVTQEVCNACMACALRTPALTG